MADLASQLEAAAFRLRAAGEDGLARDLNKGMRDAVAPVPGRIRAGLVPTSPELPDRYAATLDADLDIAAAGRSGGGGAADATVQVYAQTRGGTRKLKRLDAGLLTHPLYGNREKWFTQSEPSVRPGWFTGPCEDAEPQVRAGLERALDDTANRVARGA